MIICTLMYLYIYGKLSLNLSFIYALGHWYCRRCIYPVGFYLMRFLYSEGKKNLGLHREEGFKERNIPLLKHW